MTETAEDFAYRYIRGHLLDAINAAGWNPTLEASLRKLEQSLPRYVMETGEDGNVHVKRLDARDV